MHSQGAATRLGFSLEGIMRRKLILKGVTRDIPLYSMLATKWPRVKGAMQKWLLPDKPPSRPACWLVLNRQYARRRRGWPPPGGVRFGRARADDTPTVIRPRSDARWGGRPSRACLVSCAGRSEAHSRRTSNGGAPRARNAGHGGSGEGRRRGRGRERKSFRTPVGWGREEVRSRPDFASQRPAKIIQKMNFGSG